MRLAVLTLVLAACPTPDSKDEAGEPCIDAPVPLLATDVEEVDFGYVADGGTVEAVVQVRNDGDAPLSIDAIGTGDRDRDDFIVSYTIPSTGCVSEESADGVYFLVLQPGCSLPVTVAYTPAVPGGAADALVIESSVVYGDELPYAPDPIHAWRVVWLEGATDGELGAPGYAVGSIVAAERTALHEGASTELEVRWFGPESPEVVWSTDDPLGASFDDPGAFVVTYTAPEVDGLGMNDNLYATFADADGQDWVFGRLQVWDGAEPLEACE